MYPVDKGFFMPPEWVRRQRSFMEWPNRDEVWTDGLDDAKSGYAAIAKAIAEFEPLTMIVNPEFAGEAQKMCGEKVEIIEISHDDSWIRDNGPTFVIDGQGNIAGINWKFNAWGEKYKPFDKDDGVAAKLLEIYNVEKYDAPIVMEGGSIHVDGRGTLLTTEECLLNKNRNPSLGREEIVEELKKYIGIKEVIWLKRGLFGDETDGHIDNVACFADENTIVIQTCSDKDDPNYEISQDNLNVLANAVSAEGKKYKIVEIEQPPVRYHKGERLTLSYLNYYPVNGGIILPVFGGDAAGCDEMAAEILQKLYPDRKIVKVNGMPIIKGGGNVHCITQQMPEGGKR